MWNPFLLELEQGSEQSNEVAAGGPHPGPVRHVRHGDDLEVVAEAEEPQRGTHQVVLDVVRARRLLVPGVLHAQEAVRRGAVDVDVDVLVDGGAADEAAVLRVVGGQVGPPAPERDAERRA